MPGWIVEQSSCLDLFFQRDLDERQVFFFFFFRLAISEPSKIEFLYFLGILTTSRMSRKDIANQSPGRVQCTGCTEQKLISKRAHLSSACHSCSMGPSSLNSTLQAVETLSLKP